MSEEMTPEVQPELDLEIKTAPAEPEADPSPAIEEEQEKKPQNRAESRINQLTAEKYKLKAELEEERRLREEAQKVVPQPETQPLSTPQSATAPPSTDLLYGTEEEQQRYHADMAAYQRQITLDTIREQEEARNRAEAQRQRAEEDARMQSEFIAKANNLGVSVDEAFQAAQTLQSMGINPDLGQALAHHNSAPALMDYLAKNPAEFDDINGVSNSILAAQKLLELESKALTRNVSAAPEPAPVLSGMSARESEPFSQKCPGAVFK